MAEVQANGISITYDTFGSPGGAPVPTDNPLDAVTVHPARL